MKTINANGAEQLSPKLRFFIACCQSDPSEDEITFIHTYLRTLEDYESSSIIALVNSHGILPLVYKAIKNLSIINSQSLTLINELKAHYQIIAHQNMLMSVELIRIMKLLRENGIEALAFKGPTLAQMAYGDITLRQYADLDVLLKKKDIYKADSLLKTDGYERLLPLTTIQEKIWIKNAHDLELIHSEKGIQFEIHWSLLNEDYPMQIELEDFWKEIQTISINDHSLSTFSNENLLLYLCIHGAQHHWERIEWIKDIDLLICKNEINWEKVKKKVNGTGFEKMVYLGLFLSASLFRTVLPEDIQSEIAKYPQIYTVVTFIFESWHIPKNGFQQASAILKLFPGNKERLLYLHKVMLKPSLNEYRAVDLPQRMYWAYYFIRPYMLLRKYFRKLFHHKHK